MRFIGFRLATARRGEMESVRGQQAQARGRRRADVPYFPKKGMSVWASVYEKTSLGPTTRI